jgi:hypothetical protein
MKFPQLQRLAEGSDSREYFKDFTSWKKAAVARGMDKEDKEYLESDTVEMRHGSVDINLSKNGTIVSKWNPKTQEGWVSKK